jgi:5-methylcytosine-specific restriction endonuclease McrA
MKKPDQKTCDKLLTPLVKKLSPKCLLCGNPTQVAHHHVHKSKSLVLRYDLRNLIPLCNGCHFKLHYNESYWASKIVEKKGLKWFKELDKKKNEIIKPDYPLIHSRLLALLNEEV